MRVDLRSELFSYTIDERASAHAPLMDGKLLLVSNVVDLTSEPIFNREEKILIQINDLARTSFLVVEFARYFMSKNHFLGAGLSKT